jgi:hypothetical protein
MPAATRTRKKKKASYEETLSESTFQARIIQCAKINGWCVGIEDLDEGSDYLSRLKRFLTTRFPLKKVRDFLWGRKDMRFTLAYHTFDSRNSQKGWPDLVLVHPRRKVMAILEVKKETGTLSLEQTLWFPALEAVAERSNGALIVRVVKPSDFDEIVELLGGLDSRLFV